jgi:hypothetical protein
VAVGRSDAGEEYIWTAATRSINAVTDPETIHERVERRLELEEIPYFRLNPGSAEENQKFCLTTLFDEWEPKKAQNGDSPGEVTLRTMRKRFDAWYESDPEIDRMFRECARMMVYRRRKRVEDTAKWERYVTGSHYRCQQHDCGQNRQHTFRDKFEAHCSEHQNGTANLEALSPAAKQKIKREAEESREGEWRYQPAGAKGRIGGNRR